MGKIRMNITGDTLSFSKGKGKLTEEIKKVGLDAYTELAESHEAHVRQVEKLENKLKQYKQLDCEGVDVSDGKGKITHVEKSVESIKNGTPITEQTFIDFQFKRTDVPIEESGADEPSHYYTFEFGDTYAPTLMSNEDFTGVNIFNLTEDYKTWKTEEELKTLMILFDTNE